MDKEEIINSLVKIIATSREFCVSLTRESEIIREWAQEENLSLTKGMVRIAREKVTEMALSDGSALNHIYYGG